MTLKNWLANGWLREHDTSADEVADLLGVIERDLRDASVDGLSADWRMNIAYNAALQVATLALAAEGYRAERQRAHERTIQSLRHTIGAAPGLIDTLDGVRRKRNLNSYERSDTASSSEADEVYQLAVDLRGRLMTWLEENHPELMTA